MGYCFTVCPRGIFFSISTGGALGALDSQDTLDIRVYQGTGERDDRFSSMADRKPDVGFSTTRAFDTSIFQSQSG